MGSLLANGVEEIIPPPPPNWFLDYSRNGIVRPCASLIVINSIPVRSSSAVKIDKK